MGSAKRKPVEDVDTIEDGEEGDTPSASSGIVDVLGIYRVGLFRMVGLSPLLMDNGAQVLADKSEISTKSKPSPKDAEARLYRNDDGTLYLPTAAFRRCVIGVTNVTIPGGKALSGVIKSGLFTVEPRAALVDPATNKPIKKYEVLQHVVTNRKTSGGLSRLPAYRPSIASWAALVRFQIDVAQIKPDPDTHEPFIVITAFNRMGVKCGVGCFRVENGGEYGRFRCEFVRWES